MTLIRDTETFKEYSILWKYMNQKNRLSNQECFALLCVTTKLVSLMAAEIEYLQKEASLK